MTTLDTLLRRLRLVLAAVAALALLVVPSSAMAKKRHDRSHDRNHDGIPDKWEKKFGISTTKKGQGKADPDKDGLTNRFEWRARTNPKSADTNGNGVGDANEDPDRDQVDNGNEARERTKPRKADSDGDGVKDGSEDADRDRLDNAGEDDAATDPINPDTDGDGVKDGDEHAGEITAWDGTTLTIRVYGGSTLTGIVDENTYVGCAADSSSDDSSSDDSDTSDDPTWSGDPTADELGKARARQGADDPNADDPGADDPSADDPSDDDPGADDGSDDGSAGDDGLGDDGSGDGTGADVCLDALKVGAVVSEASLDVSSDGSFFDTVELAD
jgi:hypothetical protein